MLHPKKPASVAFFRNTYVGETEWLRVTITFWMVTRNHYAQSEMITIKKLFFGGNFSEWSLCIVSRFHLNVTCKQPTSLAFFRNTYVDEIEWLRVTITLKAKWLRSKNVFFGNFCEWRALHCESTSFKCYIPRNQHLSSFWETLTLAKVNGYA